MPIRLRAAAAAPALTLALAGALAAPAGAQQVPDSAFAPPVAHPAYALGAGPVVCVDEAHENFHTVAGRYHAFAALARRDGWVVRPSRGAFDEPATLGACTILVVANALAARNVGDWSLPTPSAFTAAEVRAVRAWVEAGGRLLLVADHMPFAGAAADLGAAFGVTFSNGFTFDAVALGAGGYVFRRSDATLRPHPITDADPREPAIDSVLGGNGSAFRAPAFAPLLVLGATVESREPRVAWRFTDDTRTFAAEGWLQGAAARVGRGRVAVFGEASTFTAQLSGPARAPMGMNHPAAAQNPRFALRVLRWLAADDAGDAGDGTAR